MDRTVPRTASEEIELYLRTIYSLLRTTAKIQIRTLEEVHAGTNSSLHPNARKQSPDMSAFIYGLLRLPPCIFDVKLVILGQSDEVFSRHGYADINSWEPSFASARRRRCFFNGQDTLACFIASRTDIDDVIPILTAFQIEWNKLYFLLQRLPEGLNLQSVENDPTTFGALAEALQISLEDLNRLKVMWKESFVSNFLQITERKCSFSVRLLGGSLSDYWRSTRIWWDHIEDSYPDLLNKPLYFISSNNHSVANMLSGFALQQRASMMDFINQENNAELLEEWNDIRNKQVPSSEENFLYYVFKKFQQTEYGKHLVEIQDKQEEKCAITRIRSQHTFDVDAQVIELSCLDPHVMDPRLCREDISFLSKSDALILNIDYPLGLAAYNILGIIAEHAYPILGIYTMGKAATLNGVIGDVIIPDLVQDEHSQNSYLFRNAFKAADVTPYLVHGTVLDHQKSVTVLGTFLQNARVMDVIYRDGYTDIEMEAGPYLSAVYELARPKRHPVNEIVNLHDIPFDLGIIHYASDTPLSKGKNLGAGTLSYFGMDSTYAATLAILNRIIQLERQRLS
jgi:hypothetical protein